uniref:Uncharacterized protein n=1 Tax=Nelumbo nucifera TaxID=4432 RepID=A0A822XRZ2_NELNU|nr:TPA_asm: hypothetical protein HUJ06_024560 [Nelumbo nucifera]
MRISRFPQRLGVAEVDPMWVLMCLSSGVDLVQPGSTILKVDLFPHSIT